MRSVFVVLALWANLPVVITQTTTISNAATTISPTTNTPTYMNIGNVTARPQRNRTTLSPQNPEADTTLEPMNIMGYAGARPILMSPRAYSNEDEDDVEKEADLMLNCSKALAKSGLEVKAGAQNQQRNGTNAIKVSNLYDPILHQCFLDNPYDLFYPPRRDGSKAPPKMRVRYAFSFVELVKFEVCCFISIAKRESFCCNRSCCALAHCSRDVCSN